MPICRFAAEPPQGGLPPEETLHAEFLAACLRVETEEGDPELEPLLATPCNLLIYEKALPAAA